MRKGKITSKTWRTKARTIINAAIKEGVDLEMDGLELKKFVSAKYPWGERKYYPYKAWLQEMNIAFPREHKTTPSDIKNFWIENVRES